LVFFSTHSQQPDKQIPAPTNYIMIIAVQSTRNVQMYNGTMWAKMRDFKVNARFYILSLKCCGLLRHTNPCPCNTTFWRWTIIVLYAVNTHTHTHTHTHVLVILRYILFVVFYLLSRFPVCVLVYIILGPELFREQVTCNK